MSEASNSAAAAADIVAVLHSEAARCLRLAGAESEGRRRADFESLARSYEETAREISVKRGVARAN